MVNKLGRGLSSLLGDEIDLETLAQEKQNVAEFKLADIIPNTEQPRKTFNKEALEALASSIKQHGVIQPILIRKSFVRRNKYEVIVGERRFRAAQIAKLENIPAVLSDLDDNQVLQVSLIENMQREDLGVLEEAESIQRLMIEFSYTQEEVAKLLSRSRSYIANITRVLALTDFAKKMLAEKKISLGHVKILSGLSNIDEIIKKIIKNHLSVRNVEMLVKKQKKYYKRPKTSVNEELKHLSHDLNQLISKASCSIKEQKGKYNISLKFDSKLDLVGFIKNLNNDF